MGNCGDRRFPLPVGERVRLRGKSRELAQWLRREQTDSERRLWEKLRDRQMQGLKFRRQHPIGSYIVDFCCPERKVVVEVDGGQHTVQVSKDGDREAYLAEQGYSVLRFWNHDVLSHPDSVLEQISEAVKKPSPQPSPWKGEGN